MKKLFAIIMALALSISASALTLDTAEGATETAVPAEETALAEDSASNVGKPGYNLWTGTTSAYTFDGDLVLSNNSTEGDINKEWASAENVFIDTTTETGNSSLHMKGDRVRFSVNSPFSIDANRPVTLNYRFKSSVTSMMYISVRVNKCGFWLNGASPFIWESAAYQVDLKNGTTNNWTSQTKVFLPADAINKTYETAPTTAESFWFQFASSYSTPVYIDDVSFIPHYKITYNLGAGTGETPAAEYFLADNYTLGADTSSIIAPADSEFSHWVDQFGRKFTTTVSPVLGEDLVLTAVYLYDYEKNAPGINIWTGTSEPYTFEDNPTYGNNGNEDFDICWSNSHVDSTTESDNISMAISGDHPNFTKRNVAANIDADRPITYSFKFKTYTENNFYLRLRPNSTGKYKMINGVATQCIAGLYNQNLIVINDGSWVSQSITATAENFSDHDVASIDTVNNIYFFAIQSSTSDKAWIDDVSIIPNYKVTYNLGEGTGETPAAEYFLADEYTLGADLTKITAPAGKVFAGWIDQNGKKYYDTVTPTLGQDLVLTAVFESYDASFKTLDIASMRYNGHKGIRTAGFIYDYMLNTADEYGFIATTESKLGENDASALTFGNSEIPYVYGVNYIKGTDTNIIYCDNKDDAKELFGDKAIDADGVYFTCVYVGIPETAEAYTTQIIGRSYVKIGENYYYGAIVTKTVYDVAVSIKNKCDADGTAVPAEVANVISIVEASK